MQDRKTDLTGQSFGRLTVVRFDRIQKNKTLWWCVCSCGTEKSIRADALISKNTNSCGCLKVEQNAIYENLTGNRYGQLVVLEVHPQRRPSSHILWKCRCDCGNTTITSGASMKSNHTLSCGCLQKITAGIHAEKMGKANTRHGKTHTREYETWHHIRQRCHGTSGESDRHYHDRGIQVCERWDVFENFLEDMGPRPSPRHQIDRIDVNGDYCPENCRWVLPKEQQRNRRNNVLITYQGKTQCIAAWAEEMGFTTLLLWQRLQKYRWSVEKALTTPVRP